MAYARSAKVGFRVVAENMDELTRANDLMDKLKRNSRDTNDVLSHFGRGISVSGFQKINDKFDQLSSKANSFSDNWGKSFDSVIDRSKSLADKSREYAGQASKAFSDSAKEIKSAYKNIPNSINIKVKTNLAQTKADMDKTKANSTTMSRVMRENMDKAAVGSERMGTRFDQSMSKVRGHSDKTSSSFGKLYDAGSKLSDMGTMVAMAMVPVAAAFKKSADEATNLQNRYTTIRNLIHTGGESSSAAKNETAAMAKENNQFATRYGVSPVDMAKGGEELIRRGYNGKQELGAHEYFLQAARASGDPYLSVVNNAAPALESFGYKNRAGNSVKRMKEYTKLVTNQMAYGADLSATNFSGTGEALKYASQVAHSAHESLASTVAAIGIMSNRGLDGSLAGTGLRKVINAFASPNLSKMSQQGPIMEQYHIKQSGFYNKNGQLKSLPALLDYINHQTRHLTTSKKDDFARKFFGTTGQQAGLDLMELVGKKGDTGTNTLRGLTRHVGNAQNMYGGRGYDEYLAKKNMKSWQNQIKQFKQFMNVMGLGFTKTVLPFFTKSLHSANKFLDVLIKLPKPMKEVIGFGTATAAIGGSAYVTSKLFRGAANLITGNHSHKSVKSLKNIVGMAGRSNKISRGGLFSDVLTSRHNMFGGILGKRLIKKNAGQIGSRVTKGGIMRETSTFGKVAGAGVGIGIAASSGFDLYKAIKSKNRKTKFKDFGKSIGTAVGGGVGFFFGGTAGAAVGSMIGNVVGGWAGKAVHKFSKTKMGHKIGKEIKPVTQAFKSAGKGIKKSWDSTTKGLRKPFESAWNAIKKSFNQVAPIVEKSFKTINDNTKPLQKLWRTVFVTGLGTSIKIFGNLLGGAFKVVGTIFKGIAGTVKGVAKIVGGTFSGINDLVHGRWSKAWKDAKEVFGGFFDIFTSALGTIKNLVKDVFGTLGKIIGNVTGGVKTLIGKLTGSHKSSSHHSSKKLGSHAQGGLMSKSHRALVGEGGPELAYMVNGRHARLLGENGPEVASVKSGERIINAQQTKRILNGGLGAGLILNGYADGKGPQGTAKKIHSDTSKYAQQTRKETIDQYDKLQKGTSKQLNQFNKYNLSSWKDINSKTGKQTNSIQKGTIKDYDQLQKGAQTQLNQFDKYNTGRWNNIKNDTGNLTAKVKNNSISDYDDMQKGVQKQMDQLEKGVVDTGNDTATGFGKALGKMGDYAHSAMSNTVDKLNGGISGIDKVLSQFGGNNSVINKIHYAQGTNGKINRNQLAIINDAGYGSRQEAIVHNGHVIMPKGQNQTVALQKGDQVLNGSQVKELGLNHFAKGSGVSHSELRKLAEKSSKNPTKAFNNTFNVTLNSTGTDLQKGTTALGKNSSDKFGAPWSAAMWSVIENAIGSDGVTGSGSKGKFLQEAIKLGKAAHLRYSEAANLRLGPNAYDCSGLVYTALKKLGITLPGSTTGPEFSATKPVSWKNGEPGDLAFYNGHVGIVSSTAGEGRMWNAENPTDGIKYGPIKDFGGGFKGLRTVPGLSSKSGGNKTKQTASSRLEALAKKELGSKALGWIKKNLQVSLGSAGSLALSGDIASRAKKLAAAIKRAYPAATNKGIAAVLGNWEFESGLNPGIQNSIGASGLGQWLGGRFSSLKSYASSHGESWKNAGTQIDFALKGDSSNSSILKRILRGTGSVASLANAFSSDWERGGYNAQHVNGARKIEAILHNNGGWSKKGKLNVFGEKDSEVAINPKKKTADGLIASVINARSKHADSPFSKANLQKVLDEINRFNPLAFNPFKSSARKSKTSQPVVVNFNATFNINADSTTTGKQLAAELELPIKNTVQKMFADLMSAQERGNL